jgi:outer membrane protein OmpU
MKKILFGTTALAALGLVLAAAPAVAQAPAAGFKSTNFDFTVGGYARQFVGVMGNQGNYTRSATGGVAVNNVQTFDQQSDLRLIITAATTMSNGIRVGQRLDWDALGATSAASSQIRRNWSFLSGGFGELRLGSSDAVTQQMFVGAPDAFTGPGSVNDGKIYDNILAPVRTGTSDATFVTNIRLWDRSANKIAYFTPRFEGFQLGVNYTPDATQNINGSLAQNDTGYRYGKAIALNYTNTLAGVAVQAYGGYLTWEAPAVVAGTTTAFAKDPDAYGLGLNLAYMGFGLGGSWAQIKDGLSMTRGNTGIAPTFGGTSAYTIDGNVYEIGVSYTFGPAMVSLNYLDGKNEAATYNSVTGVKTVMNRDETRKALALNGNYTLAPGVLVMASAYHVKQEGNQAAGGTINLDQKATGLIGALILNF